jgi:hypothetical protein
MPPYNVPAHKQTDPTQYPGQIVNQHDMMDDMMDFAEQHPKAIEYRPVHGGYPDYNPAKEV